MYKILVITALLLGCLSGMANNIKIGTEAKVTGFVGSARDTAIVEFNLSWENSWRDDFNWDAAWIFLKYKKRGVTSEWHHAYLAKEGHTATTLAGNEGGEYMFMSGEVGSGTAAKVTGIYLLRDNLGEGKVNAHLTVKWPIKSNTKLTLSASDFGTRLDSIFVAAYAVEMVYVPFGEYILGDGYSNNSFFTQEKNFYGVIPSASDIVTTDYTITANNSAEGSTPRNIAKRIDYAAYRPSVNSWYAGASPSWWAIDFKSPKKVLFFGVSVSTSYPSAYKPATTWRLEGSNDNSRWTVLSYIDPSLWTAEATSYPVQHSIRVSNPGNYRYYRLYFPSSNIIMQNVAMTEENLFSVPEGGSLRISSEDPLYLVNTGITLPANYPKGYQGYYLMKYEVSQEQYVEFLNSLTLVQQKNRVANTNFEKMLKGDYVFGNLKQPNCRNGIAFLMMKEPGAPAVFGNNLNPDNKFYSEDDGQTLACNYLSPADMLAYCDWSGLRPMSELEYEKACRRPYPQIPDKGEFAWNTNTGVNKVRSESDLNASKTERETPYDYKMNVNAGGRIRGPLRSGAFATSRTNQQEAGATYWGLMEMSGNLWEMCYNAVSAGSYFVANNVTYSHGDGYITTAGTDVSTSYWPNGVAAFAVRGGGFPSGDTLLRTSDRTYASGNYFAAVTTRDSSVGFRGARSILNTTGFTPGRIYGENGLEQDTVCSEIAFTIGGVPAEKTIGKTTYTWYISENNGTTWTVLEGSNALTLMNNGIKNTTTSPKTVLFKRKAMCAVGELFSNSVKIVIPAVFDAPALEDDAAIAIIGQTLTLTMPTAPSGAGALYVWTHPNGAKTNSATLTIPSFTLNDAGVYYASYSGACDGNKKAMEIYPYEEVGKQQFLYKGSEETATVPETATHIRAYLIGASGGGGAYSTGYYSGAGGFTDVLFPVGVGQVGVIVGQGGRSGKAYTRSEAAYPNGGIGQGGDVSSGSGGGRSQVRFVSGNSLVAIAGGGGGNTGYAGHSGAGGGLEGQNSTGGYSFGGTQTKGQGTRPGSYLQGAHANTNTGDDCGGGGDGYYGGGTTTGDGRPAAGGSGYINRKICIMGKTYTGNLQNRPTQIGTAIAGYLTGTYGVGVVSLSSGKTSTPGNNGMVVLQYLKRLTK